MDPKTTAALARTRKAMAGTKDDYVTVPAADLALLAAHPKAPEEERDTLAEIARAAARTIHRKVSLHREHHLEPLLAAIDAPEPAPASAEVPAGE